MQNKVNTAINEWATDCFVPQNQHSAEFATSIQDLKSKIVTILESGKAQSKISQEVTDLLADFFCSIDGKFFSQSLSLQPGENFLFTVYNCLETLNIENYQKHFSDKKVVEFKKDNGHSMAHVICKSGRLDLLVGQEFNAQDTTTHGGAKFPVNRKLALKFFNTPVGRDPKTNCIMYPLDFVPKNKVAEFGAYINLYGGKGAQTGDKGFKGIIGSAASRHINAAGLNKVGPQVENSTLASVCWYAASHPLQTIKDIVMHIYTRILNTLGLGGDKGRE